MQFCLSDDETEATFCLPRNLSYAEESYLDSYSVSSSFVNTVGAEKRRFYEFEKDLIDYAVMSQK